MTPISKDDWDDILTDIKDQKAVLLIGPELMQIDGKPLNRHLRDSLHQRNPDDIAFYYERDGFFLFKSPESKVRVARQVKRFYRDMSPDEGILQQIVQIPFHLVVSVNPDTFVSEAFYRSGVKHRFHYFQHRHRDNENDEIEKPTRALPLVYNLFGSKDQDDSLVLDYDDVYKMLQSAFSAGSLPNKMMRTFKEASTYIFLGFQFDKWYSQLLLKFLSDNGRREKLISINNPLTDEDSHQFVIRQFQIQFMGDQFDFFGELHKRCDAAKILRGVVFNTQTHVLMSRWSYEQTPQYKSLMSSFSGIKTITFKDSTFIFWGAGGRSSPDSYVMQAVWDGKQIKIVQTFAFKAKAPATVALPNEVSIQEENGELFLYTVLNGNNQIVKTRVRNQEEIWTMPTGVAPFGLRIVGNAAFVTNWAGPVTNPSDGLETAGVPWGSAYINPQTGAMSRGTVSVFDAKTGQFQKEINVGLHPNAIISSADNQFVYVANGNSDYISVIDTKSLTVVDSIFVGIFKDNQKLIGSTPNALALDNTGTILYVANGMDNAIAVVKLGNKACSVADPEKIGKEVGQNEIKGYIPTQAYPSGIVFHKNALYITNLEAIGARAAFKVFEEAKADKAYNSHHQLASVSFIPLPNDVQLSLFTEKVKNQSLYKREKLTNLLPRKGIAPRPVPERIGEPSVFKHVLYIIKENRTYDQVLGDMKEGDGMASLCIFGDSITPNQHSIARNYLLMDNYYVSGKSSAEGHHWASAGMVTDYTEKSVRAWFRSYPHVLYDAMVYDKNGLIWNNALDHGKTARIYGEACTCEFDGKAYDWQSLYALQQKGETFTYKNTSTISRVRPILAMDFPGCNDESISDQMRADAFLKELKNIESDPKGQLPNLMVMSLPNDHTSGMNPKFPTPRAMVADNDLAVGRIVDAIMHSRFADSTVIFISEDDSQAGWDHVSAYRTTGYVVSKYSVLKKTVHTNYNQTSLLRTIEQILGLPPMNIIDATASPMFDCFSDKKDTTYTFSHTKNTIPLNEMNKPMDKLKGNSLKYTQQSIKYAFNFIDQGKDDVLNRIIWYSVKGNKPYPAKMAGSGDEDDE